MVGLVVNVIGWLGYSRIILKADNEPAIQALVRQSLEVIKVEVKEVEQVTNENPPAYDSQANGGTEVGVRIVRGMVRTLELCLEARINKHIPVGQPMMALWLTSVLCFFAFRSAASPGVSRMGAPRGIGIRKKVTLLSSMSRSNMASRGLTPDESGRIPPLAV